MAKPCPACDQPIPPSLGTKPRRWCSNACRTWNLKHPGEKRQLQRTCVACGVDISHMLYGAKVCSKRCSGVARGLTRPEPLPDRDCSVCGTSFTPWSTISKYCSKDCRERRPRQWRRPERPGPSLRARVCEVCGKDYDATYAGQRTCSRTCGAEINAQIDRNRKVSLVRTRPKWAVGLTSPVWWRECRECGRTFASPSAHRRICSEECRGQQRRNYLLSQRAAPRSCACGTTIPAKRRMCDPCAKTAQKEQRRRVRRRRRARERGAVSEPYTLAEIAARDRRNCQLCGKRVAMTKQVPHPKAPVIDHVLPLARGGDDTRANVQLAHFMCNSVKSAGGTQQLALIG